MLIRFLICSISLALFGCASAPSTSWQHTSITDQQAAARLFLQDIDYCTAAAEGAVPMPQIQTPQQPVTTNVNGQIRTYNSSTGQTTYHTYNGVATSAPSGGFAGGLSSGLSSGFSIGASIAASERRERLQKLCMINKGWIEVPAGSSFAAPIQNRNVEQFEAPQTHVAASEFKIYESTEKERAADLKEFYSFYPGYEQSVSLNQAFNQQIRLIQASQPQLTGPKLFILAHQALSSSGKGAPPSRDSLALKTYLKAVDGSSVDQAALGILYMKGAEEGLAKDLTRSAYWSQKSAISGNPTGQAGYGLLMFLGQGVKANRVDGYKLVKQAAEIDRSNLALLRKLESEMTQDELKSAQ